MAEQQKEESANGADAEWIDLSNVRPLFGRQPAPRREPPATDDELAEYRRLRPLLIQMLREWEMVKDKQAGCPVLGQILP